MPTARELLEQADALMRRNRRRDRDKSGGPPTLTDALGIDRDGTLAPTLILPDAVRDVADSSPFNAPRDTDVSSARDAPADPIALDTLSDVPVLTDVVDVWPAGETPDAFVEGRARFGTDSAIEAAGTLDDASWLNPTVEVWCSTAQPWIKLDQSRQLMDKNPPLAA